ncbi:uncharacterized protein [Typha latifolia]|uniref:uncharacterized protein n=1 Tax=Typha latifolia TaxID=4733 RepID=UPI003C2CA870
MRVHPAPKKRNGAIRYAAGVGTGGRQKKLRRLPHIFSKVLELPFGADADVTVEEDSDGFRFVAATNDLWGDVRAKAIAIHPGVMKVVIRDGTDATEDDEIDDGALELNRWRFRLPPCTRPALATAAYVEGELVVVIPKAMGAEEEEGESGGEVDGEIGRLVIVTTLREFAT